MFRRSVEEASMARHPLSAPLALALTVGAAALLPGVRVPASWRLQCWDGSAFADSPGAGPHGTAVDRYNEVAFPAVTTTSVRAVLASGQGSVGILEWRLTAADAASVREVHQPTLVGQIPDLPGTMFEGSSRLTVRGRGRLSLKLRVPVWVGEHFSVLRRTWPPCRAHT
jgi:hypothetical protein